MVVFSTPVWSAAEFAHLFTPEFQRQSQAKCSKIIKTFEALLRAGGTKYLVRWVGKVLFVLFSSCTSLIAGIYHRLRA